MTERSYEDIRLAYEGVLAELLRAENAPIDRFDDEPVQFARHMKGMKAFAEIVLGLDHQDYGDKLIEIGRERLKI